MVKILFPWIHCTVNKSNAFTFLSFKNTQKIMVEDKIVIVIELFWHFKIDWGQNMYFTF
jgi:hypothetical protein